MKKRLLSILLTACVVLSLLPGFSLQVAAADTQITSSSISITAGNTYTISNAAQLGYFRDIVNNGNNCAGATIKLTTNITISGAWTPIGNSDGNAFKGTFDGAGCTISGLMGSGLFGFLNGSSSKIENVGLLNVIITSGVSFNGYNIGGIVAYNNYGTVQNCYISGTLTGDLNVQYGGYLGGMVGWNTGGTVQNCYSTAKIIISNPDTSSYPPCWGGIVGYNHNGTVQNCYYAGSVIDNFTSGKTHYVGGIAANYFTDQPGYVKNCYWLSGSPSLGIGVNVTTSRYINIISFNSNSGGTFSSACNVNGDNTYTGTSLVEALNAWVNNAANTDLKTWTSSESYPVFSVAWVPPTYPATVTVNKDGGAFGAGAPTITLGTTVDNAVANGTSVANGTYNIYANGIDTGVDITVSGSAASVDLNYYTVTFRNGDDTSTLDTQTVLSGQPATYGGPAPTKTATAQYTYVFSNWVTAANGSSPATLNNITAAKTVYASFTPTILSYTITWKKDASTTIDTSTVAYGATPTHSVPVNTGYTFSSWTPAITSVTGAATYTATWTLDTYTINYTLNGGTATNPTTYQFTTGTFTLNNPTREGFSFVGWSGTGLTGSANQTVTIAANSTGNKTYTANWKANKPTSAPASSIVTAKTDMSLTITTQEGYEYSVDGTNWYSGTGSHTFTDLSPNTPYNLVCRKAAVSTGDISSASDASDALSVITKAAAATAPVAPTLGTGTDKPTSNSITVSAAAGNEYYISTSAAADWSGTPNGYFKATVSGPHKFDGLTPTTQYYIHVRVAETENAMPSASDYVAQYTLPATPVASVVTVNYASETISFTNTYEVSTSTSFTTTIASGGTLMPGTTYYVRVKAASGAPASEAVSFAIAARPAAPTVITANKTKNSITITPVLGQEYKIEPGTGNWQDSGSFTGLSADIKYTVYSRVKATGTSFASVDYSMDVTTKSAGSVTVPTLAAVTYDPNKKLANTTLPANWAWSVPATVPTVAINSYSAVYTPTDTAMVDYSGEAGYAVDGSGKVTITRTVPLMVNRATPTAADFTFTPPASLAYSGTAKTATVTPNGGILGMGTVTVKYYQGSTEIASPTNVGTYTVKIDLAQGNNYAAATAVTDSAWTFTIAKVAQAPLSITGKPASVTYGDTFTLATAGGSGTGAVTWAVTSGSSATVNANTGVVTITGVGETTITATKAADGNYTDAVINTYTFTPAKRLITVDAPLATGGWTKTYNGKTDFDKLIITVGGITNKVGSDAVNVSVQSVAYDTAAIGSGDKTLTITYAIDGAKSGNYLAPNNAVISTASITAATPTITLKSKTEAYTDKKIEIDAATVKGVTGGTTPDGVITYTYYTKDTCTDADKTSIDKSGAEAVGGAPKAAGTYYVKATIAASGNYGAATSTVVTLTIYYPSSGADQSSAPVIVDGKTVDIGTSEVKDGTTTVKVDQNKMSEQLKNAKDSVVVPVTSKTDTAAAQLVVQNVEDMAKKGMTLTVQAEGVNYNLPATAVDTAALLKGLDASDSSKVTFTVTMAELSKTAVTIKNGTLMVAPMQFTVTAAYNGKSVNVENFASYVQRDIELPSGVDPKTITTAVVVEQNGTERHVPTEVYSKGGKWYAKINSMTNSTYALIQSNASFTDTTGKWYAAVAVEMASRKVISGIGENMFAGERAITRAEFAAILVRALGLPADGTSVFSDVSASAWYSGAVATATQYGLVTGKGDNRFTPDAYITRQEAMTMLQRAAKLTNYSGTTGSLEGFTDAGSVGTWAQGAAKWNVGSGLIVGSGGLLRPNDNISRAESATIILRLLQKTGLVDVRSKA